MNYNFSVEDAIKYGVNEAIFISNLRFWILTNKANKKHFHFNRTWSYNSIKSFSIIFPFWSIQTIRTTINSLIQQNIIMSDNFNTNSLQKTLWYAFVNEDFMLGGISRNVDRFVESNKCEEMRPEGAIPPVEPALVPICENQQIDLLESTNDITDIKQTNKKQKNKKPNKKQKMRDFEIQLFEEIFLEVYNLYPKHARRSKSKAKAAFFSANLDLPTAQLLKISLQAQIEQRDVFIKNGLFTPCWRHLSTWINQKGWEDDLLTPDEIKKLIKENQKMRGCMINDLDELKKRPSLNR